VAHKKTSPKEREQINDSPKGKSRIQQKEKCMYFLSWIIVGWVVGWSAGKILKGNGYGPFMDIAMGVGGAVAGGLLMRSAGFGRYGGAIITTLAAMMGAVLLTLLAGFVNGRRTSARQL
jgi:uncharacterized membrane protein YeaQ/YmgE (transglycosylase-associated protein family)